MSQNEKLKMLVEDTTGPAADNIATIDEIVSVDAMFQQSLVPSLGRQIFSVVPIKGPTAALFNIRKKTGANDFELIRKEVEVYPSDMIRTGITQESFEDIKSQYGKYTGDIIGNLLRSLANEQENSRTYTFLNTKCKSNPDLVLSDSFNAELNLFEIGQRVQELILKINSKTMRSYEAFAVVPYTALGGLMHLRSYVGADDDNESGLFITKNGQTSYYMNPFLISDGIGGLKPDDMCYVGIKDTRNSSKSSAVFCPYQSQIVDIVNPDDGALVYFIVNRFAITESPLHETDNEMLHMFKITT